MPARGDAYDGIEIIIGRAMAQTTHFAPTPAKLLRSRFDSTSVVSVTALAGVPEFVRDAFGERVLRRANQAAMLDIEDQDCLSHTSP
jgi:hypothetical protein